MHGDLYRVSIHQRLNTFGLVSVGQLVCSVYVDFDLAAGCFFDQFSKLPAAFCPGTGFCRGAGEVPGLLRPVEIASVFYIVGACRRCIFLCKGFNQIFGIVITCGFQCWMRSLLPKKRWMQMCSLPWSCSYWKNLWNWKIRMRQEKVP